MQGDRRERGEERERGGGGGGGCYMYACVYECMYMRK